MLQFLRDLAHRGDDGGKGYCRSHATLTLCGAVHAQYDNQREQHSSRCCVSSRKLKHTFVGRRVFASRTFVGRRAFASRPFVGRGTFASVRGVRRSWR
jgi:hypothetical protein